MRQLIAAFIVSATCSQALAFSEAGHKIISSIAFRQLTPDQQAKIAAILKKHPRFEDDFQSKMPAELTTRADQNEWIFQQAGTWSDIARGFQGEARREFHRPTWHYINVPSFLTPEDRAAMEGTLKLNLSLDPPVMEEEGMNAIQAIRFARRALADKTTPDDKKAVLLCWIFHDVGDIHQPLHSSALFARTLFPAGDRGGNSIQTAQRRNLHAVWDQFLGVRAEYRTARNRAIAIVNDPEKSRIGKDAAAKLDENVWMDESHALCDQVAYDAEVRGRLRGYAAETEATPIMLTERYLKEGGRVSEQQVIEADYRLGAVLKGIAAE